MGMVQMGRAFISIGVDTGPLWKALGDVRRWGLEVQKIGKMLLAVSGSMQAPALASAFGVEGLRGLLTETRSFISIGDQFAKMAQRTGASAEALSELAHVADLSGANIADVETSLKLMQRAMSGVTDMGVKTEDSFKALGVSIRELQGLSPDAQLMKLADAFRRTEDPAVRTASALGIFGRSGTKLLPMLSLGAEGIAHFRDEAKRLGLSISGEQADAAAHMTDMVARMRGAWQGLVTTIGGIVAPMYERTILLITNLIANFREWIDLNPNVVRGWVDIAKEAGIAGAVLIGVGAALRVVGALLSPTGIFAVGALGVAVWSGYLDEAGGKLRQLLNSVSIGGKTLAEWGGVVVDAWKKLGPAFEEVNSALKTSLTSWQQAVQPLGDAFIETFKYVGVAIRHVFDEVAVYMSQRFQEEMVGVLSNLRIGMENKLAEIRKERAAQWGTPSKRGVFTDAATISALAEGTHVLSALESVGKTRAGKGIDVGLAAEAVAGRDKAAAAWKEAIGAVTQSAKDTARAAQGVDLNKVKNAVKDATSAIVDPVTKAVEDAKPGDVLAIFKDLQKQFKDYAMPEGLDDLFSPPQEIKRPQFRAVGTWSADLAARAGFGAQGANRLAEKQLSVTERGVKVQEDMRDSLKKLKIGFG
jgi:hypothetical protein